MPRPLAPLLATASAAAAVYATERRARRLTSEAVSAAEARVIAAMPVAPSEEQLREQALVAVLRERPEAAWRDVATPITDQIHARLAPEDVEVVESRLEGAAADLYAASDARTRRRLLLNFAAAYHVEPVLELAGMSTAMPPEDVHAMARGPVAAGGDCYLADLVFDALENSGVNLDQGASVLDFGASSGRVLRAVAAGRPDLDCLGCDPNADAIAWASEHLPMARFFVSPLRPPLDLADGSIDLVYAISIWTHFAETPAVEWLAEMHRIVAPGGAVVITTHAFDCLSTLLRRDHVSPGTAVAAATAMIRGAHHFVDVFGPNGDWGVRDEGWGNAYFSLEWLASRADADWDVALNWSGALDQVQDVVVLRRR